MENQNLLNEITNELKLIWLANKRAGLKGKMCLYSIKDNYPWPGKTPDLKFWFGEDETDKAVEFFKTHYNDGRLPNTPLLLDPVVYEHKGEDTYEPVGSALLWATALSVSDVPEDKLERIRSTGAAAAYPTRAGDKKSGLKMLAFSEEPLAIVADTLSSGSKELYNLASIKSDIYRKYYLLSGVSYLSNAGIYDMPDIFSVFELEKKDGIISDKELNNILKKYTVKEQTIKEASLCWDNYDHHNTLYARFGNDVKNLEKNLVFYNYCARDFELFDATGPGAMKSESGKEDFEFLVHGLIPKGSIVVMAGTGGTGKSSLAHKLCCLAATDWKDDEQPMWLGQPVNKELSKGIVVYFTGEDGPPIINARNEIFDPEQRAKRLMFQRTNFTDAKGNEMSFADFLRRLQKMPEVPLLVIDPARKYLTGDEDDSAVVSHFFEAIEEFCHTKKASVIVVHHLSKGAKPKSAREVLDELRGSQVFIDRPRVVIGMFREGPKTIVGLGKCNIPPSLGMVTDERVFAHNPKTLDLTQLPGKEGVRAQYIEAKEEE